MNFPKALQKRRGRVSKRAHKLIGQGFYDASDSWLPGKGDRRKQVRLPETPTTSKKKGGPPQGLLRGFKTGRPASPGLRSAAGQAAVPARGSPVRKRGLSPKG